MFCGERQTPALTLAGIVALALAFSSSALAFPGPLLGTENIPQMMSESTLVCKGEVIDAPAVTFSVNVPLPRLTATAIVRADRCFKGQPPGGGTVPVLFDNVLPASGGSFVVLQKGDYRLYFLKPKGEEYVLVDPWFGQLLVSRNLASDSSEDLDPMHRLEADLKAGLTDPDRDRVLDSIRMLGNMRYLQSEAELIALRDSPDSLVQTTVWEAMLRLHDYSVLPAVEQWLTAQPPIPASITLPKDALFDMQQRLVREISTIRDPATIPILVRLLHLPRSWERFEILNAIRAMKSPEGAPYFLKMLDDGNSDVAFAAMQGLIELAGGSPIDWVPSYEQFRENRAHYAGLCRQWWRNKNRQQ